MVRRYAGRCEVSEDFGKTEEYAWTRTEVGAIPERCTLVLKAYLQNSISSTRRCVQRTYAPADASLVSSNAFKGIFTPTSTPTGGSSPPPPTPSKFTGCAVLRFKFLGTVAVALRGYAWDARITAAFERTSTIECATQNQLNIGPGMRRSGVVVEARA